MAFAETAPLIAQLDLKGNFTSNLKKAQSQLGSFSASLGRTGKGVGQLGAGFARAGALIAGAAVTGGVAVAKMAIDFEDAFAGVRKTVDEAELAAAGLTFEDLAQQFRDMATEIPIAATELAAIGEAAGALGIRAQDIEEFTRTVALLGATTNLTTEEASESLGKIGTILNLTGQDFENFADILVNLGNKGASTESEIIEITKRFAASGKQAGLSVPQILAYASAIASAGAEPEAAGSSLSRLFGNLITDTANATDKGKAFAKITGKSFKDFAKIVKDDTNGAMLLFLDSLNDLDKFEQQKALAAVGITNVRDRNAILLLAETYDENLVPALKNAQDATGALSEEAQKRFDTLKSQLLLLRNNFIEAGITIGEGFLPALKTATEKLIAFLQVDANKSALKTLGEDIGKSLDGIDWDSVLANTKTFVSILKDAAGVAMSVLSVLNKLPTEIKAAGLGFLALNKLSGGLIGAGAGNVIGGLAGTLIRAGGSRLPIIGAAFAQPVFVTNWPPNFGGGNILDNLIGGKGLLSKIIQLIPATALATLIVSAAVPIGEAFANALPDWLKGGPEHPGESESQRRIREAREKEERERERNFVGPPTPRGWKDRGTEQFGPSPFFGPPTPTGQLAVSNFQIDAAIARGIAAGFKPTRAAAEATVQRNIERLAERNLAATNALKDKIATDASVRAGTLALQSIGQQKPPITNVAVNVNVTAAQVTKSIVKQVRYGPSGGSRDRNAFDKAHH